MLTIKYNSEDEGFRQKETDCLSSTYEKSLGREVRKSKGVYYTPRHIISYILSHTVEQADVAANPYLRVLDPACGCGDFLVAAFDVLMRKFRECLPVLRAERANESYSFADGRPAANGEKYWQEENLRYHILRHCLFGADCDADAALIAKTRLATGTSGLAANIIVCDSLRKWETQGETPEEAPDAFAFWQQSFDYILGNPPYIPVTRMSREQKTYYRANYQCAAGRMNTFVLFLERAIEKATSKVGMILPSRLLLNTQYAGIRQHLLSRTTIENIYEASEGVFSGAVVDTVVLILAVTGSGSDSKPIQIKSGSGKNVATVAADSFRSAPNSVMSFAADAKQKAFIDVLENCAKPLGEIADIRDGIIQGAVGAELFLDKERRDDSRCKQVLFGCSISTYSCSWQGDYIWYDQPALTALESERTQGKGRGLRLRTPAIFERPKILTRQTADHIIAAMDSKGLYYMNTLHGTYVTNSAFDPWYVLAVMNSTLIRCWYAWRFAETGRSFAQVKIANLKTLPIPLISDDTCSQIAQLAHAASDSRKMGNDITLIQRTIDELLYRHCRFDQDLIQIAMDTGQSGDRKLWRQRRRDNDANTIY